MGIAIDMSGENYEERKAKQTSVPAGTWLAQVSKVSVKDSKTKVNEGTNKPEKYFEWDLIITSGPAAGTHMKSYTTAIKGKRWLLKQALECCGIVAADGKYNFDLAELTGKTMLIIVEVSPDTYIQTSRKDGSKKEVTVNKSVVIGFLKAPPQKEDEPYKGQF